MAQFMLLLRDDRAGFEKLSPKEMEEAMGRYMAWSKEPFIADANRLKAGGRVMVKNGDGIKITDGPYAEAKEVLGGYYTINAADLEEAVAIAKTHPHLDFGTVELREVYG
jgi:hypothetical protein